MPAERFFLWIFLIFGCGVAYFSAHFLQVPDIRFLPPLSFALLMLFLADTMGPFVAEKGRFVPLDPVVNNGLEGLWTFDGATSPCVDGGDPAERPWRERMPNGGRVNLGAYGNTLYASMSEWPIEGDINRDGVVNLADLALMARQWLSALPWAAGG